MFDLLRRFAGLLRGFVLLGAGNYGAMAVALVISAILTHRLGTTQFGRLALLLMASQVLLLVFANWTQIATVRFGAQEFAATSSVANTFWARMAISVPCVAAAGAVMFLTRYSVASFLEIPTWGLLVVVAHFIAQLALTTIGSLFQAKNEMHRYGVVLFFDKAVLACVLILVPALWTRRPLAVLAMYAASSASVALCGVVVLRARALRPAGFPRQTCREMLAFSLPLILSSWAGLFGTSWFDLIVLKWYWPVSELGLYSLGTVLAGAVQQVTVIFSTLLLPPFSVMVARGELDQMRGVVNRLLPYWFLVTSVLFTIVMLSAGSIVPLIFGKAFSRSVIVIAILMLAACALALFNAFSPLVSALGSTWALTGVCLASGVANVVGDLLLIRPYGIAGAAGATAIAFAVSAVLVLFFIQTKTKISVWELSTLSLPVAAVSVCFALFTGVRLYVLAIPSSAAAVLWLVRRFGLFRRGDLQVLERFQNTATAVPQR